MEWIARIPSGVSIEVDQPTWFLARIEAANLLSMEPGALTVVQKDQQAPQNGTAVRCEHCGQVIRKKRAKK